MKTLNLLVAVSATAAITISSYLHLSSDKKSTFVKPVEGITSLASNQNGRIIHEEENKSAQLVSPPNTSPTPALNMKRNTDKQVEMQREARGYARLAPPPPLAANQSRDARHNDTQGHGHEHAPVSKSREVNEPAPPSGAIN